MARKRRVAGPLARPRPRRLDPHVFGARRPLRYPLSAGNRTPHSTDAGGTQSHIGDHNGRVVVSFGSMKRVAAVQQPLKTSPAQWLTLMFNSTQGGARRAGLHGLRPSTRINWAPRHRSPDRPPRPHAVGFCLGGRPASPCGRSSAEGAACRRRDAILSPV